MIRRHLDTFTSFEGDLDRRHFRNLIQAWAEAPGLFRNPESEQFGAGAEFYKMLAYAPAEDVPDLIAQYLRNFPAADRSMIDPVAKAVETGNHAFLIDQIAQMRDLADPDQWLIWSLIMAYAASAGDMVLLQKAAEAGQGEACPSKPIGAVYQVTAQVLADAGELQSAFALHATGTCDGVTFHDRVGLILRSGDTAALSAAVREAYSVPSPADRYDQLLTLAYALVRKRDPGSE